MAVFATHVVLMRDFQAVRFAPGDGLPEWAEGLVGAHCLEPETGFEPGSADVDTDVDPDPKQEQDPEPDETDPDEDEPSPAPAAVPDFTAPAPVRRRGRSQK
jgi:hypothetical protein